MNTPLDQGKLDRARKFLEAANEDFPTRAEVAKTVADVVKAITTLATTHRDLISNGDASSVKEALAAFSSSPELTALQKAAQTDLPQQIDAVSKKVGDLSRETDGKIAPVASRVAAIEAAKLAGRVSALENAPEPQRAPEETPESIRNKLEMLKGSPSALAIDAIFGLSEKLDALKQAVDRRPGGGSVIAYSRGQIKLYDLSDQLDGSKKTFSLPSFWRVISVQSTSTPNAFRPTVDYTTDAAASSITFTSQIDAASTLSSGQTLTVMYAEA